MKRICLLIIMLVTLLGKASSENVAYAIYFYGQLRFGYGELPVAGYGEYITDLDHQTPKWNAFSESVKEVIFEESFTNARPKSTARWFSECKELKEIKGIEYLNTSEVTDMNSMFSGCSSLTSLDVSHFNTSNVTNMGGMFLGCSSVTTLDVSGFNTSNVTNMFNMFSACTSLTSLDVRGFNTSKVQSMKQMFYNCWNLMGLDVSGFNTSNVKSMEYMFSGCKSLEALELSGFNTSNVTNMQYMFSGCSALTGLDVSGFNTSNVSNMQHMFSGCKSLTSLELSGFNTSNVTNMYYMFSDCSALTSLDVSGFNTSKVTNMGYMFYGCKSLTKLDVSGFNTSKVTNMGYMFFDCESLENLDVRGFNTSSVANMNLMFKVCSNLTTIYCNDSWRCDESDEMFGGCKKLRGVIGYNYNLIDVTYANPETGYFTYKAPETRALSINGTIVTDINERDLTKIDGVTGTARYDNATKTLTLTDAMIYTTADNSSAIQTNLDSLYIVVDGECMIGSTKLAGITGTSHVVIKGSGKLTVVGVSAVVLLQNLGSLTVADGVKLDIQGYTQYGINGCNALKVNGKDTKLRIFGTTGSCKNLGALTLTDNLAIMDPLGAKYSNGTIVDIDGNEIKYSWVTIEYAEPYDLTLNGTQVTAANNSILNTISGVTGTASYDPDTKTLNLEDASIIERTLAGGYAIKTTLDTLHVNVEGECNISSSKGTGIFANSRNVVIGGTGTLDITAGANGIVMNNTSTNTLDIDGKVTVSVTAENYGIQGREYIQRVGLTGTTKTYYRTTLKTGGEGSKLSVKGTAKCFQTLGGFTPAEGYKVTAPTRTAYCGTVDGTVYNTFCRSTLVISGIGKTQATTVTLTPVAGAAVVIEKPYILGDVNGDGNITMADANEVVNYFLATDKSAITNFNVDAANVNGDDGITIADANEIVGMFLNGTSN